MAILKFDQVTAPDFRGVSQILSGASESFNSARKASTNLFKDLNTSIQNNALRELQKSLNSLSSEEYDASGRNFLFDPRNQELIGKLNKANYDALTKNALDSRSTLLGQYSLDTFNKLKDLASKEGYLDVYGLLSDSKYQQMYDSLAPEVKAALNTLDPKLYNYRSQDNYSPKIYDSPFQKTITYSEEEKSTNTEDSKETSNLNNVPKVNEKLANASNINAQEQLVDLSNFTKEELDAANKYLDYYKDSIKSLDELPSQKLLPNRLGLVGAPNPIKYNERAYEAAKAILKNNELVNKRDITSPTIKTDKIDYSVNSPQLLSIAQEISKVNPEQGKLLTNYASYDPKENSFVAEHRKNSIDEILKKYASNNVSNASITPNISNKATQVLNKTATATPTNSSIKSGEVDFDAISGLTKRKESGSAGIRAVGYDPKGGKSYGDFQINSNMMPAFIKSLKNKYPDLYEEFKNISYWNNDSASFYWKRATENPIKAEMLSNAQKDFAKEQYWNIPFKQLTKDQQDIILSDPGLQMAFYDAAVNGGANKDNPVSSYQVFNKAFEGANNTNEIIRRMGEIRSTGGFTGHSKDIQNSGANRVNSVTEEALKASTNIPLSGGKLVSTPTSITNNIAPKESPSITISEEAKQKTNVTSPKLTQVNVNAKEILTPGSGASNLIHRAATEVSNKLTSAKQEFYKKLGKVGLSEKQLDEVFEYDQLPQTEQVNKATNNIMDTLVNSEYTKEMPIDSAELKTKIARIIANGVSEGIPPKVTELALLKSVSENTISQLFNENDFDVEDINFKKIFPDGIDAFIEDYTATKQNLKNLELASTNLKNSAKALKELQANYAKFREHNLTGQANNIKNEAEKYLRKYFNIITPEANEIAKGKIYSY